MLSIRAALCVLAFVIHTANPLKLNTAQKEGYHTDEQIQRIIDFLSAQNPLINKKTCPSSALYNYVQIGEADSSHLNAVIICNIHARELIASQICLNWLLNLKNDSLAEQKYFTRIFVVANANRQTFVRNISSCVRKNQNNVDANRNFPTDFNHWNADVDNQTYPGKAALDQPFSQCLNALILQNKPDLFIDFHSGMNGYFYYQQGVNNEQQLRLLEQANSQYCNSQCSITTLKKDGQTINGHIFADMKVRMQVPYSFLFETFYQNTQECFSQFNPIGEMKETILTRYTNIINFLMMKVRENNQGHS